MITLSQIIYFLSQENIEYDVVGKVESVVKFASIKNIEENALYYAVGNSKFTFTNSIILCDTFETVTADNTHILLEDPQLVFYKLMRFYNPINCKGIHQTATIDEQAVIGESVSIGANSVIGKAFLGNGVSIKENVVIHDDVVIGDHSVISASTVIGADGVAWIWDQKNKKRVIQPQIGGVRIGKNVYIGSNVTIARGSVNENTEIFDGVLLSHGSQIGHGVLIEADVHIANNVAIAGNAVLEEKVFVGSGAVIVSQIKIAKSVTIGAGAVISKHIDSEGVTYIAMPARAIPSTTAKLTGVPLKLSEKN